MDALHAAIDAMPAGDNLTFLVTVHGKSFSAAGFGNWFREVCNESGLPKRCTSHGLRKAAATYLADRGATKAEKIEAHRSATPPPIRHFRHDVPEGLASFMDRLLAKPPAGRPATAPAE